MTIMVPTSKLSPSQSSVDPNRTKAVKGLVEHREEVYKRLCVGTSLDPVATQSNCDQLLPEDEDDKAHISNRNDEGPKPSLQFDNDRSVAVYEDKVGRRVDIRRQHAAVSPLHRAPTCLSRRCRRSAISPLRRVPSRVFADITNRINNAGGGFDEAMD